MSLKRNNLIFTGQAGSGKSHSAVGYALKQGKDNIYIIRSAVPVRDLGFLPGSMDDKIDPYFNLYKDLISKHRKEQKDVGSYSTSKRKVKYSNTTPKSNPFKYLTTSYLRGETLDDAVVILDEAQNCTLSELETVLGRVGKGAILIVCGDQAQCDLPEGPHAFNEFIDNLLNTNYFKQVNLTRQYRSDIISAYYLQKEKEKNANTDRAGLNKLLGV